MKKQTSQPIKRKPPNQKTQQGKRPPQGQRPVQGKRPVQNQRPPQNKRPPVNGNSQNRNPNVVKQRASGQNPVRRKQQRTRIDPREMEIRRRREEVRRFYVKKRRESMIRVAFGRVMLFLIMFAIVFVLAVGLMFLDLVNNGGGNKVSYTYQIGKDEDKSKISRTVTWRELSFNGEIYINTTEIAGLCGFTVTGNTVEHRYIFPESNEEVKFLVGTTEAFLNGTCIRLSYPVYNYNNMLYVPLEFYTNYVRGITVTLDSEQRKVTITRNVTGTDGDGNTVYEPVTLTVKREASTDNIPESSLDYDIRILTEPRKPEDTAADTGA